MFVSAHRAATVPFPPLSLCGNIYIFTFTGADGLLCIRIWACKLHFKFQPGFFWRASGSMFLLPFFEQDRAKEGAGEGGEGMILRAPSCFVSMNVFGRFWQIGWATLRLNPHSYVKKILVALRHNDMTCECGYTW